MNTMKNFKVTIDAKFDYSEENKEAVLDGILRDNKDLEDMDIEIEEIKEKEKLKCKCGFEGEVEKEDKEVTCPKCLMIYKKCVKTEVTE